MAITHRFIDSRDYHGNGYSGFIENGQLVLEYDTPREGGTIFRGSYVDAADHLLCIKEDDAVLYDSIMTYYNTKPKETICDEESRWLRFREEAHNFEKESEERVIKEWLREAVDYHGTIGYYFSLCDKVLEIYTTDPGELIGKAGWYVETLKLCLTEEFGGSWYIKFTEVRGGFVSV